MKHAGRGVIRLNDPTDHGGRVISASSTTTVMGKEAALADDLTFCPRCKGKFLIIPDGEGAKHIGKSYAYDGDMTACGARLISTLAVSNAVNASQANDVSVGNGCHALGFNDHYVLRDEDTDEPLAMIEYAIEREDGRVEFGMTDQHGKTHLLSTISECESVRIFI